MPKLGSSHAVLISINLLLFAFTVSRFAFFRPPPVDESPLEFGTPIHDAALQVLKAQGGLSGTRTHTLLLFLRANDARSSEALGWLSRSRTTSLRKLTIAAVFDRQNSDLEDRMPRAPHLYTIVDQDLSLHSHLKIAPNHKHGGTVVIRKDGRVDFSAASVLPSDEIRQLVEKYEFGEIRYASIDSPLTQRIRLGGEVPDFPGRRLLDGKETRLALEDPVNAAVVVFGTVCPSCDLRGLLLDLAAFSSKLQGKRSLLLLFLGFDHATLSTELGAHLSWKGRSIMIDPIDVFGLGSRTRFADLERPLVIFTDANGFVERTMALPVR